MFDRNEFLERIKTEITEPMLEYMEEAEIDDFNGEDVARCGEFLAKFVNTLAEMTWPTDAAILAQVEQVVVALNELNEDTDYALIETVEREAIALLIQDAVVARGMRNVPDDVTEEWRDW